MSQSVSEGKGDLYRYYASKNSELTLKAKFNNKTKENVHILYGQFAVLLDVPIDICCFVVSRCFLIIT